MSCNIDKPQVYILINALKSQVLKANYEACYIYSRQHYIKIASAELRAPGTFVYWITQL